MGASALEKHFYTMIQRGNMYTYMESQLGRGICLTLGADFPETSWTGLLTKGSNGPDPTMSTLRKSRTAMLAENYSTLRDLLVDHKVTKIRTRVFESGEMLGLDAIYLAGSASADDVLEDVRLGQV